MRQLNKKHFDTQEGASALPGELSHPQLAPSVSQREEDMRQDIIDSISRMDDSALIDTGYTLNIIDHNDLADYQDDLLKRSFYTNLKRKIKQKALADENIAEYVLQY